MLPLTRAGIVEALAGHEDRFRGEPLAWMKKRLYRYSRKYRRPWVTNGQGRNRPGSMWYAVSMLAEFRCVLWCANTGSHSRLAISGLGRLFCISIAHERAQKLRERHDRTLDAGTLEGVHVVLPTLHGDHGPGVAA